VSTFRSHGPSFVCPFCGLQCQPCESGKHPGEADALLHAVPECPRFVALDVLSFMKACNLELARRRGVGLT